MTAALVWSALAVAALGHGFIWSGIVNRIHGWGGPRRLIKSITVLCAILLLALPCWLAWRYWQLPPPRRPFSTADVSAAYLWACLAVGSTALLVKPGIEHRRYDRSVLVGWTAHRVDVAKSLDARPLHGFAAKLLGRIPGNEALQISIDRKRLVLPSLPAELAGLSIAHISDLHMTGAVGQDYYAHLVRQVNSLRPDVIAITGDIIESDGCRPWLESTLGQLCAPLGVFFILGNHDLFIDVAATRRTLVEAGMTCLSQRWLRAEWNGVTVSLGGNELPWLAAPRLEPGPGADASHFRLVLSHSPDQFRWCQEAKVDLMLAGHTHGGQVQLPLLGVIMSPSLHGTRYACGVFRQGPTVMHVTRGVAGETPWRWRCPPEVALLELVAKDDASIRI
jgi:predicted MPP superfamily phosphohydrolase